MSSYKSFMSAAKTYAESTPFLKFLLSARIVVFALGGLLYVLGIFLINIMSNGSVSLYDAFTCVGVVLMLTGLLLNMAADDAMTIVIVSLSISVVSLVAWIVLLARSFPFFLTPLFYFLAFGAVCLVTFLKAERFVKMRAEAAARSTVFCPRCGTGLPIAAAFCSNCGTPNPTTQYAPPAAPYAPPAAPYAPPAAPYAPPAAPYAPPAAPYAPPAAPYAPPAAPYAPPAATYAPPVAPYAPPVEWEPAHAEPQVVQSEAYAEPTIETVEPEKPEVSVAAADRCCSNCGAELPPEAAFCGKCGTRQ